MTKLPVLSAKEAIRALKQADFVIVRQRGSHVRLKHADGRVVTVPSHTGQDIARGLLRKILRDAEITPEALENLLTK